MEPPRPEPAEPVAAGDALDVVLLVDTEHAGVALVRAAPGLPSPPAHVHHAHAECFAVLSGALRLVLEGHELRAEAGSLLLVPPHVMHTFVVEEGDDLRFLDVHTPACGYGAFVRDLHAAGSDEERAAARERFDQHPAPPQGGADPALAVVCPPGGGEVITDRPGWRVALLADVEQLAVTEALYGPGRRGPAPHVHHHHADGFLVLEGTLTFSFREGGLRAEAGTLVLVPPDVVHSFANGGPGDARFLNLHAPSCGFGDYLRGRHPAFDQHPPPADGGGAPSTVVVRTVSSRAAV